MRHVFVSLPWLLTESFGSCFPQSREAKSELGRRAIFHPQHGGAGGRQRSTSNRKTDGHRAKGSWRKRTGKSGLRIRHGKVPVIVGVYYLARGNCTLCHPQALNGNYQVKLTKWDVVTKPPFRGEGWQWAGDGWGVKACPPGVGGAVSSLGAAEWTTMTPSIGFACLTNGSPAAIVAGSRAPLG